MEIPLSAYNIRPTERRDCNAIAALIKELAVYEKMADQPKLSGADLARDAFDVNPPLFQSFVAEVAGSDNVIAGYALYFYNYSTWEGKMIHLEDIYISPKYRHSGLGSKMFKYLAKVCVDGGFARLKLECLDWNESAIKFYEKHNVINMTKSEGWNSFRCDKEALKLLAKDYSS